MSFSLRTRWWIDTPHVTGKPFALAARITSTEFRPEIWERVEADLVLLAIGQEKLTRMLAGLQGIQLEGGRVVTDADGRTLSVMLGNGALIDVGGGVFFRKGKVKSINGISSLNPRNLVNVTAPLLITPPV